MLNFTNAIEDGWGGCKSSAHTSAPHEAILEALDLHEGNSRAWLEENDPRSLQYRDNGSWNKYRSEGRDVYSVDVGCFCSHDCCGHLCSLSYTFHNAGWGITRVVCSQGINI